VFRLRLDLQGLGLVIPKLVNLVSLVVEDADGNPLFGLALRRGDG
jgi:hypothetical protein